MPTWCSKKDKPEDKPLAKVGDSYLYKSELNGYFRPGITSDDSIIMFKALVEKWIRKQLIVEKAKLNLTQEEMDVEKELDDYRTSLIIYKYEQKMLKERLDTVVQNAEIEKYYNQNTQSFNLNSPIVKAQFIKLSLKTPQLDKLKLWLKTDNSENVRLIDEYCYKYNVKYNYFNDEWISFENIKMMMPFTSNVTENYLAANKVIELTDSTNLYLLKIRDIRFSGTAAPLEFVKPNIKSIIILKRKQQLINELEDKIYFEALDKNGFELL
jgi:hypothetical protein